MAAVTKPENHRCAPAVASPKGRSLRANEEPEG